MNVAECYGVLRYASIRTSTPSVLYELLSHTQESESMVAHCYATMYYTHARAQCLALPIDDTGADPEIGHGGG